MPGAKGRTASVTVATWLLSLTGCGARIVAPFTPAAQLAAERLDTRLFLVGDAGDPRPDGEPVLLALRDDLARDPSHSLVLFLGDNIYPRGLPDSTSRDFPEAARRLDAQIDLVVASGTRGYFVPGNHDWDRFGPDGWNAIRRQGARIATRGAGLIRLEPEAGCPGPVVIDEGRWLRLVLIDTQWWLQGGRKPKDAASGCATYAETAMGNSLRDAVAGAGDRRVVVAGHHPLATGGEHGGFFDWKDHLFPLRHVASWLWLPLPVLGSAYPLVRNLGISAQDLSSGTYQRMQAAFSAAFADHPPILYAAGHDHGLQFIEGGAARFEAVSGAGIYGHHGPIRGIRGTDLALSEAGYMRVEVTPDGGIRLSVVTVDRKGRGAEVYSRWLEGPCAQEDTTCRRSLGE